MVVKKGKNKVNSEQIDERNKRISGFWIGCQKGNLKSAQEYFEEGGLEEEDWRVGLQKACSGDHWDVVEWLIKEETKKKVGITERMTVEEKRDWVFGCIIGGGLEVIKKWCDYDLKHEQDPEKRLNFKRDELAMRLAWDVNNWKVVQWLIWEHEFEPGEETHWIVEDYPELGEMLSRRERMQLEVKEFKRTLEVNEDWNREIKENKEGAIKKRDSLKRI